MSGVENEKKNMSKLKTNGKPVGDVLADVQVAAWRNPKVYRLMVLPQHLLFYSRGPLWRRLKLEEKLEVHSITGFRLSGSSLAIDIKAGGETSRPEEIAFDTVDQAAMVRAALAQILGPLDEIAEKARLELEEEERRKKREQALRSFQTLIRAKLCCLWETTKNAYGMAIAVTSQDWDQAHAKYDLLFRYVNDLQKENGPDVTGDMEALGMATGAKNGGDVIGQTASLLSRIADELSRTRPRGPEAQESWVEESASPNWGDALFFFLFSVAYYDALLSRQAGDWLGIQRCVRQICELGPVMEKRFSIVCDGRFKELKTQADRRDAVQFLQALEKLGEEVEANCKQVTSACGLGATE
ncbi:MAG: hypothetical protein HYX87_04585 [Chloroflexi bacterium]|nr:hypothetical protein [Chloroflexota bacterium]